MAGGPNGHLPPSSVRTWCGPHIFGGGDSPKNSLDTLGSFATLGAMNSHSTLEALQKGQFFFRHAEVFQRFGIVLPQSAQNCTFWHFLGPKLSAMTLCTRPKIYHFGHATWGRVFPLDHRVC